MKTLVVLASLTLLLGCGANVQVQTVPGEVLRPTDTVAVVFEFDRINLAAVFAQQLAAAGFPLVATPQAADLLLTGTYSASHDVIHQRFDFAQFKLVRQQTGRTVATLQSGQGGLQSTDTVVRRMVEDLARLRPQP
jgi:hypothetical protein